MKNRGKNIALLLAGIMIGGAVSAPAAKAVSEYLQAVRSTSPIYVDGQQVELEAYNIDGCNYVKLRDIGKAVGFEVYWDGTVQIETDKPYTGIAPEVKEECAEETVALTMVGLINELRRENGLSELNVSDALMAAARERAEMCAELRSIEHDKNLSVELLLKYGYGNGGAACNLGSTSNMNAPASELVSMFKESPGHLATMLMGDAEDIGVGVYVGSRVYVAMYFGNENWY